MKRTPFLSLITTLALVAGVHSASAEVYTWTPSLGAAAPVWSAANWAVQGTPEQLWVDGNDAVLPGGLTNTEIGIDRDVTASSLTVQDEYTLNDATGHTVSLGEVILEESTTLNFNANNATYTLNGGTLAKGSKFSFSGNAAYVLQGRYNVTNDSTPTENGYVSGGLSAQVAVGSANVGAATWTLNGLGATYSAGTISTGSTGKSTYFLVQDGTTVNASAINAEVPDELEGVVMNAGTLFMDADLGVKLAAKGGTIDLGDTPNTYRAIPEIALEQDAHLTIHSGLNWKNGSSARPDVKLSVAQLTLDAGTALLTVGRYDEKGEVYLRMPFLAAGSTVVGDGAHLVVNGLSSSANTLGALTLGKGSELQLAGHRYTQVSEQFKMTVGGTGLVSSLGDGSLIHVTEYIPTHDKDAPGSGDRYATYTLAGEFHVSSSNHGELVAPEHNGFADAQITATVLRNDSGSSMYQITVDTKATWYLNGTEAAYKYTADGKNGTSAYKGTGTVTATTTAYDTWFQLSDTTKVSDIMTAAGEYSSLVSTVELTGGVLAVDGDIDTVNAKGGSLAFDGGSVDIVNVESDTTVSGDEGLALGKAYKIAAEKIVTFEEGLQLAGLSIVGAGGVTVKNVSESTVTYALGEQGALLSADEITMTAQAEANVTVGNQVAADTVKNESESGYTLTLGKGNTAVNKVIASKGNIVFHNMGAEAISLAEMTIGEGKQVGVYQGTDTDPEATVSISNTLNAGGGTLLANLDLQAGSTLNLGGGRMTLGSELTLQEGLIQLDAETLAAIAALQSIGDTHILINNATGTTLSYEGVSAGDWARTHFDLSSITDADYKIVANGTEFGLVKWSNVPEPTTGTLGLLALAALAARRRR